MKSHVSPAVLVAIDDPVLFDEVIRFLEEVPHWRLTGSVATSAELERAIAERHPDAVIISDSLAFDTDRAGMRLSARFVVVGRTEHPRTLRSAIRLGAKGFVTWPAERRELRLLVEEGLAPDRDVLRGSGALVTVWSPKGGSGSSVIACSLAAESASLGSDVLLLDLDLDNGDVASIITGDQSSAVRGPLKSIADLLGVVDEIDESAIDSIAMSTDYGFKVVLSPSSFGEMALFKPTDIVRVTQVARASASLVLADAPSGYSELLAALAEESDRFFVVVIPTVLSLKRARDALRFLGQSGIGSPKVSIIMNQSVKGPISHQEVESILGTRVDAEVRADLEVLRATDKGEVSTSMRRDLRRLAANLTGAKIDQPRSLFSKR
ncbi:MAG: CpaE family protein [Actinomycetota bacterium]|nr:hypothetical protein [Actinomycetota bacterium]